MNQLDVYYRALKEYRALTAENRECTSFRRAVSSSGKDNDVITVTRNVCFIDEDWIVEIEKGLVFVENAINEERQFIYSNGEVLPIEKVKSIAKESVVHLAKHSNLITREQKNDEIIPDSLYSVERLNDFAIYENRFLYMLLCYLKDFVTVRYDKILELSNKYDGVLKMKKEISLPKQKITYTVDLHDERKDDKYLREINPSKDVIDRIDLILKTVLAFLATPLMEIAGKAAKLKPPITKTNVLKMNKNFKGAVALYDYIIAYDKPGYSIEEKSVELAPFSDVLSDELAEACALQTFLTYEYGLCINEKLKNSYVLEEERRKAEAARQKEEQAEALKRKLLTLELTPEEYILEIEKQIRLLQNEKRQLEPLRNALNDLKENEERLSDEIRALKVERDVLKEKMASVEDDVRAVYDERMRSSQEKHKEELAILESTVQSRFEATLVRSRELEEKLSRELDEIGNKLIESRAEIERMASEYEAVVEEKRISDARIKALLIDSGAKFSDEDFTDKESFDELERELDAFVKFYDSRWKITKKKIRKKLLNYQSLKGTKGRNR